MSRATRGSCKRRREEELSLHIAETSEVADSLAKWIMLHTSARPDDFVTEDVLLSIMGKFGPGENRTEFLKRYHKLLTETQDISRTNYSILHMHKLLRTSAALASVRLALNDVAAARRALDEAIRNCVTVLKE